VSGCGAALLPAEQQPVILVVRPVFLALGIELLDGAGPRGGGSMMIAKACALAAIYGREGAPRDLALSRAASPPERRSHRAAALALKSSWRNPRGTGSGQDGKHHGRAIVSRDIML
jgi:hypothetical protein